jgi:hypothetical protein
MGNVPQLAAGEHAALARIRALAAEEGEREGERRLRAAAAEAGITLGEYQGRSCTLVRDVARVFGVTERAVQKALSDANGDLPGASMNVPRSRFGEVANLKFATSTPHVTLVFWPGFLFCAHRGRSAAAEARVRTEERERTASAGGQVLLEEHRRVLSEQDRLRVLYDSSIKQRNDLIAENRALAALLEASPQSPQSSSHLLPPAELSSLAADVAELREDLDALRRAQHTRTEQWKLGEIAEAEEFLAAWRKRFEDRLVSADQLVDLANRRGLLRQLLSDRDRQGQRVALGLFLRTHQGSLRRQHTSTGVLYGLLPEPGTDPAARPAAPPPPAPRRALPPAAPAPKAAPARAAAYPALDDHFDPISLGRAAVLFRDDTEVMAAVRRANRRPPNASTLGKIAIAAGLTEDVTDVCAIVRRPLTTCTGERTEVARLRLYPDGVTLLRDAYLADLAAAAKRRGSGR